MNFSFYLFYTAQSLQKIAFFIYKKREKSFSIVLEIFLYFFVFLCGIYNKFVKFFF